MTFAWFARALRCVARDQGEDRRAACADRRRGGRRGRCAGCGCRGRERRCADGPAHPSVPGAAAEGRDPRPAAGRVAPRAGAAPAAGRRLALFNGERRPGMAGRDRPHRPQRGRAAHRRGRPHGRARARRSPSPWRSACRPTSAWTRWSRRPTELGAAATAAAGLRALGGAPGGRACRGAPAPLAGGGGLGERAVRSGSRPAHRRCRPASTPGCASSTPPPSRGARWVLSLADAARRPAALHDPTRGDAAAGLLVLSGPEGGLAPERGSGGAAPRLRAGLARPAHAARRHRAAGTARLARPGGPQAPRMNRRAAAADAVPGLLPDQQRHLHRHQRPGRPAPGAERLAGDPADHRLRRRRRAVRRSGGPAPARLGPTARLPARPGRRHGDDRALRLGGTGRATSGCWSRGATLRRLLQRQRRPVSVRRDRAGRRRRSRSGRSRWVLAGGILGAVAGPNLARCDPRRAAGRVRRRLCRARRRRAGVAGHDLVHPLSAAGRCRAPAAPGRGRCARSRRQPVFIVAVVRLRASATA